MPREGSSPAVGTLSPLLLHKRGQAEGSRRLIPVTPPPAAFCCRRGPRDAPGAGGAPAAPVVLGGVPRAALRTRGGIGVEGGEVKTAASSRGAPGHRWDQAVEPGAFGRPLPSLGGEQRARKRLLPVREAPTGNASLPPPPRGRTGEGKQQNGAKPPQNIPAAARPGGSRPAGRGPRI